MIKDDENMKIVPYDAHPERCEGTDLKTGQCLFFKSPNSNLCRKHGKGYADRAAIRESLHSYRLAKYQARLDEFATNPSILSLRGEIGIARMTLERILDQCKDDQGFDLRSGKITQLVGQLERLVSTATKLESKLGQLMDRATLQRLCDQLVQIVSEHIEDPDARAAIANKFAGAIGSAVDQCL